MNMRLTEARKGAGLLVQVISAFPSLILLAMGTAGPDFKFSNFFSMFSDTNGIVFAAALVGVPIAGIVIGQLIKRGVRWSYLLGLLIGVGALFVFMPFGAILGAVLIFQLAKVFRYEFRAG